MPDFDAEFVDVTRAGVSATDTLTSVATANANATALQGAIDLLHMRGGGFLHFPPGRHYIGRRPAGSSIGDPAASTENGDIVVYDDVTLWFSPGAVLVPLRVGVAAPHFEIREVGDPHGEDTMVRIEIHGAIRARRSMIFETSIEANSVANDAGLILLVGTKIDEVYSELSGAHISLYPLELRCSGALHPS